MTRIEVAREVPGRLMRKVWVFTYLDSRHVLVCRYYSEESRPTTRHKYRPDHEYESFRRGVTPPHIPDDVKSDAIALMVKDIRVGNAGEFE